jgi:phosphotransferase system  glucose/maltose/N-acetylglucosamine-specific IIC component
MGIFRIVLVVAVLIAILTWPPITKALRGLLADRKELALFALFEAVAIGAFALALMVFGLQVSAVLLLACVGLFAIWALKPPAKRR